jgi:hypothetical protein
MTRQEALYCQIQTSENFARIVQKTRISIGAYRKNQQWKIGKEITSEDPWFSLPPPPLLLTEMGRSIGESN